MQMTFRNFDTHGMNATPDQQLSLEAAWKAALQFAQQPEDWLVLTGPVGCGKTHLAASIANYRLQQGQPAVFVVVPDLLDHLRSSFAPESPMTYDVLFDSIKNAPLLILDDLGAQSTTPWALEKLFQLINHRYNGRLPTVITTSLNRSGLAGISKALASRVGHSRVSNTIPLSAPDYRMGEDSLSPEQESGGVGPARSSLKRARLRPPR